MAGTMTGTGTFAETAWRLVQNGWSVFPQTLDRKPGLVLDKSINPFTAHQLDKRTPTRQEIETWIHYCGDHNVACAMGAGSGNAIAIDIDILDREMAEAMVEAAIGTLGPTPLRRSGMQPKTALLYRIDPESKSRLLRNRSLTAAEGGHAVEILNGGKQLTFFGLHHVTGRPFHWHGRSPLTVPPAALPVITAEQMESFFNLAGEIMPLASGVGGGEFGDFSGLVPAWSENAEGKIDDGREKFLQNLVIRICSEFVAYGNARDDDATRREVSRHVIGLFSEACVLDGRWAPENLPREVTSRVGPVLGKMLRGELSMGKARNRPRLVQETRRGTRLDFGDAAPSPEPPAPPAAGPLIGRRGFAALGDSAALDRARQAQIGGGVSVADRALGGGGGQVVETRRAALERAAADCTLLDRQQHSEQLAALGRRMLAAMDAFLDEASVPLEEPGFVHDETTSNLHIIKAPPGIGKTSNLIRRIAEDPRTYRDIQTPAGPVRAPFVMLVPTYRNIEELRERAVIFGLDPALPDEALRRIATAEGLLQEDDDAALAALRRRVEADSGPGRDHGGFRVATYKGKVRAGCAMADHMQLATEHGLSGSTLCSRPLTPKERVNADPSETHRYCDHYHECPAVQQATVFDSAHLVLMPHAFLSLNLPEVAKHIRGVIIDERSHDLFLHTTQIPLDALDLPRRPRHLSKTERAKRIKADPDFDEEEFRNGQLIERNEAAEILRDALVQGVDPALRFHEIPGARGHHLIESCRKLCQESARRLGAIEPNMALDKLQAVAAEPTGRWAREEARLWTILQERVQLLQAAELGMATLPGGPIVGDARIQYLHGADDPRGKRIRISWRTQPNWLDRPVLMLDASCNRRIVQKVWARPEPQVIETDLVAAAGLYRRLRTVVVHAGDIGGDAFFRTFSNYSILGEPNQRARQLAQPAATLAALRAMISGMAIEHGGGRVLVGCNIPIRRALNNSWLAPANVDFGHFGALRGLDVYKQHEAAISIGRLELPIDLIDGLTAALTYDDPVPEAPIDINGTGYVGDEPVRLKPETINYRLRDGRLMPIDKPIPEGEWAKAVQAQYREEELLQFLGRLRPFHRDQIPTWYAVSSVLPDDAIIDQMISIKHHAARYSSRGTDLLRYGEGTLDPAQVEPARFFWAESTIDDVAKILGRNPPESWDAAARRFKTPPAPRILDGLDEAIGTPEVRRVREANLLRQTLRQIGWSQPTIDYMARARKYPVPNAPNKMLDLYQMTALTALLTMHRQLEHLFEYRSGPTAAIGADPENRDYSALGAWSDNRDPRTPEQIAAAIAEHVETTRPVEDDDDDEADSADAVGLDRDRQRAVSVSQAAPG